MAATTAAALLNGGGEASWAECVDELAALDRGVPGLAFNYGSWHLVVACAMAQRALDRPLSSAAWERTVKEELGLEAANYDGISSDIPESMPFFGQWYWDTSEAFPGFAHGMRMSGRQYAKVLKSLQFEGLLDGTKFGGSSAANETGLAAFVADRTAEVEWQGGDGSNKGLDVGYWHYAQGAWLARRRGLGGSERRRQVGSSDGAEASALCGAVPTPHVVHSLGLWGAYFWMDLTNDYYGVFVHSWAIDMRNMYWIGVTLSTSSSRCSWSASGIESSYRSANAAIAAHDPGVVGACVQSPTPTVNPDPIFVPLLNSRMRLLLAFPSGPRGVLTRRLFMTRSCTSTKSSVASGTLHRDIAEEESTVDVVAARGSPGRSHFAPSALWWFSSSASVPAP